MLTGVFSMDELESCRKSGSCLWGMPHEELQKFLSSVSEDGANRALNKFKLELGLNDEEAGKDIRSLRGMLESWKQVKTSFFAKLGNLAAVIILAWLAIKLKLTFPWDKFGG